jgi:molybdate transport system substrate-binding protein
VVFACNEPVLIVPVANPAGLSEFSDLPKASRIVLGVPAVPIGKYAEKVLAKASVANPSFATSVLAKVVSREMTVRHVLAKVSMGEADAGIVYRTDAAGSKQVKVIAIPAEFNVIARYPVSVVTRSEVPTLAEQWRSYVTGASGRKLLEEGGFGCPR